MSLDADALVDRRRLRRKLTFWRVAAFVLVIAGVIAVGAWLSGEGGLLGRGQHIARISIEGLITDDRKQRELIEKAGEDDDVKAIILDINSPGGTTTGSEALFEQVRDVAAKKPVVAVLGTIATSGGYIAAISADHIVARGNTITGSIGVIFQWAQVSELLGKLGIDFNEIKSSPLKAEPSPFNPTPEEAREVMRVMIADSYDWFLGLVAERRGLSAAEARRLGDGRVYSGRQAVAEKLVDEIGGEDTARAWLRTARNIPDTLKIKDWKPSGDIGGVPLMESLAKAFLRALGIDGGLTATLSGDLRAAESLRLDGLVSVWHPSAGQEN